MGVPMLEEEHTHNSSVWTQYVDSKTSQERWMIGTIEERERERETEGVRDISLSLYIYIYIYNFISF